MLFFWKQKTAYEMRIRDWSSDVGSSDLMTLARWGRGILQDEYGVDVRKLRYRTGGANKPGRKERLPLRLPDHMDVKPIPADRCLNDLLLAGEIDAIMAPGPPRAFVDGHPTVRHLIDDPSAAEHAYYERTGIFPRSEVHTSE